MYNPNVPSSNMGIAPISGQPSQPLGPTPMVGPAPMGPPPPMAPPMMGGMPPPPMMAPPPMAPPIAPITEGLGGFGGSSAGRAGFSERMQKMTAPSKPKPKPQQMPQPVQGMQYGGMVRGMLPRVPSFGQLTGRMPYLPQRDVSNSALSKSGGGIDQYGEYLDSEYGDPQFDQKRDSFLQEVSQKEQQTFGGGIGGIAPPETNRPALQVMNQPFMGGALQRGFPSYGIHRFNSSPFGGRFQLFEDGGEVPRDVSPVDMALGGFIGNENTRDYGDDRYTDPYEELDDIYEDDGGYDPTDPYDDDGDDRNFDPPVPTPAPPVSPPSDGGDDGSGGGGGGGGPDIGSSDFSVSQVPDVAPDFKTFTDLIDPFEGQIVQPTVSAAPKAIDAVGAAPVVGAGEGEGASTEVDVLGVNPISLSSSGITDRGKGMTVSEMIAAGSGNPNNVVIDTSNIPAVDSDFTARRAGEILESLKTAPRTTAASEAARRSMSDAPLGGDDALINPLPYTEYGLSRSSGVDAEARRLAQGILAGDNQLNEGGMYPKARDALDNAAKTAAFATQGMTPGTPEYLSTLIETADAASMAGDVPRQRVITDALQQPSGGMDDSGDITAPVVAPSVTLEGMGIDPANYPTEEGLRRDRERFNTPGVGDAATAEQVKILEDIAAGEDITSEGYGLGTPSVGSDLTREDVIRLKRGLPSGEPAVVSTAPAQTVPVPATATAVSDSAGGSAPKSNFDFDFPNTGETDEVFIDPTDSEMYFKDRFEPNAPTRAFESLIKALSFGAIDLGEISAKQREKGFEAYKKTQTLAYDEKGRVIGVKDPEGKTILLGPQPQDDDDTGGDDDGCPPGFRKINGVCQPINGVSPNPADDIADDIERGTIPIIRPIIRPLDPPTGDVTTDPVTDDPSGIDFRRPNYFAGGGAVSEGMGSAIDSFISAMGGSVKKKSDVAPVGMANGGYVDMRTESGNRVVDGSGSPVRTRARGKSASDFEGDDQPFDRNFSYDLFPSDGSFGPNAYSTGRSSRNNEFNFYTPDAAAAPVYPDIMSSGFFNSEPDNIVQRSLRPQLRPASFLNESFGDRRQRLAGGPNVFDGAGSSYDVAGLKTVNDAGYDPYVSNAISSVQDYYNDGSVGPTMQNAATLSIPTPSPMPVSVIPSLSNQTLKERGYSPIQHSPLYEEEFGYTPEESIFNDFSLNLQQNQLTEDEIEQMRIRASNRARKGILSDPYTTQGLGADYAEPKLSPGLYVDPETGKRSTTMSYRDQASQDEAMNALRLIGATDAQKDGDANTNELRAIAARKLVDMGVPNSLLGVATGYLDATPYGAGTALFDAYDSSKDTVGSLAEGDLKSAGKNAAITGLNLLGGVPGALQAASLASSGIRAGTNKADDFFRQQFYNFQAQRDAMADVVPSTLAPYRSQNVSRANANYETLRNNKAKDAMNIQRAQDAYANGVSEQAILDNYGVSVYKQTDVNGQVERVRFAHAEPINSVNDVDLSKVTEAGVPISQAIKYPNNSRASVPPNKIQGMNTLKLTELTDDELAYGVGGSAYSNPITGGGYVTFGRLRDPLSGRLRPLTPGYKPLVLHEVEHIKQYDSFPNTRDFGPRGGISGYYDFKKQKLNEINQQLKDKNLTANKRADLIATRNAFKNMSASEMYNNSVKELKAKGAELGKFDPASGSGPMAVKTLSPLEIINPYFQTRGIRTLTERLNAALGSKLPSENTAISISNTLANTVIALRKKGYSNQRIDEIIGNLSRKLKEESIQNSVNRTMQAKIGDENTMGDIFDARRTVDLPVYNRPLNESIK